MVARPGIVATLPEDRGRPGSRSDQLVAVLVDKVDFAVPPSNNSGALAKEIA